jgi:hypothetical protein
MKPINFAFHIIFVSLYISNTALADKNDWDQFHRDMDKHREEMNQFKKDNFGTEDLVRFPSSSSFDDDDYSENIL